MSDCLFGCFRLIKWPHMKKTNVLLNNFNRYFPFFSDSLKLLIQKHALIGSFGAHSDERVIINVKFKEPSNNTDITNVNNDTRGYLQRLLFII